MFGKKRQDRKKSNVENTTDLQKDISKEDELPLIFSVFKLSPTAILP